MTQPLTPQQLADVAREVTGRRHYYVDLPGTRGVFDLPEDELLMVKGILIPDHLWSPGFEGNYFSNRDQALALVEWLFKEARRKFKDEEISRGTYETICVEIAETANDKDTTALCRLVLVLKGAAQ